MDEYSVSDVMTIQSSIATGDTSLKSVVKQLHDNKASCVIIVEDDKPIGIITERDIVGVLADMLEDVVWDDLAVRYFMTSPTITIPTDMPLIEAATLSRSKSIRNLPVVNNEGLLQGVLTQSNIVNGYFIASDIDL